ncbi:large ribosomal subunit protein mL48-like isoform X1 [Carassius carassius]|uniref:large ribosomal subunit protein mL48-like isoform X1 n=1 Tax=Carassius carassius TaxID=217509 RepID=UPI0028689EC7|nr:large ribosomal subunit protein mL48-like isoform X1 [Carassius carassius]
MRLIGHLCQICQKEERIIILRLQWYLLVLLLQNTRALVCAASSLQSQVLTTQMPLGVLLTNRHYRSMPTHGIGKYRHLLPKALPKKKKERVQAKQIKAATATEFGVFNVCVSGYDMTLVEHYSQYIHNLCNHLDIRVDESCALPTKSTEVMVMQEQGTKMYVDAVLKTHERIVQISEMKATLFPIFMEVILKNQPEGVRLCLKQHTEADYQARFKTRPELEGLLAKINN